MMERSSCWMLGVAVVRSLVLCLIVLVGSSSSQQDFVSIHCCANSNTTDENSIPWITDSGWFPDTTYCRQMNRAVENSRSYFARGFIIQGAGKQCYNLSTIPDKYYLVRASFVHLDSLSPSSFDVLIGVTRIGSVELPNDVVVEGVFRAERQYVDFCLLKGDEGDPYISQLELRPLTDGSEYWNDSSANNTVLKLVSRVNLGAGTSEPDIRYPNDPDDRIWTQPEPTTAAAYENITAASDLQNATAAAAATAVPFKVLQTALQDPERLELPTVGLDRVYRSYAVFLHFLEPNASVGAGERVFDVLVNGEREAAAFDIVAGGGRYRRLALRVAASGSLNLTLVKVPNGFTFGPICSAYEIFELLRKVPTTLQEDVDVMVNVREELLIENNASQVLASWSGDPCLPVPWEAVNCSLINGSTAVTKLDLSSKNLRGSIPSGISELMFLNELNLSYNQFTGSIPSFPPSSVLKSLDVRQNDLTGPLPEALFSLPGLAKLFFGCNPHMVTDITRSFNNTKLKTDKGVCGASSRQKNGFVIGTVACGSVLITIALGTFIFCFYKQKFAQRARDDDLKEYPMSKNAVFSIPSKDDFVVKSISIQEFSLECIEAATEKYKTMIGEGGFGSVYRGTLRDGQEVAVKVRSATSTQGTREFQNELNLLSAIRHENLVPLLGHCSENDQQILVYPFMSNGSLQDRLYGEASKRKILDWPTRLSIALGAARGLTYLHTFSARSVIHRDVKSSNILLDHSMCAKVADFGFSKYAPQEGDSGVSLEVRGTAGYLDPEYYSTQHLSAKSDVFSFGVVLLEIISGREPLNIQRPRKEWSLVEWAKPLYREQKIDEIVDPNIKGMFHAEAMWRVVEVALACIESYSAYRPTMSDIVRELEDSFIIENNASEYMKSIDSLGGSNRFSIIIERKNSIRHALPVPPPSTEPSPLSSQPLNPPAPR